MKRLSRKLFKRHSNPWSAWTRLFSVPLILVPIWTPNRKQAVVIAGWLLVNPVLFSKPKDDSAWATRAILGEEMWIAERPRDLAVAIGAGASAFGIGGILGAFKRKLWPTALCTVGEVALLLVYWQLMNVYYEHHRDNSQGS